MIGARARGICHAADLARDFFNTMRSLRICVPLLRGHNSAKPQRNSSAPRDRVAVLLKFRSLRSKARVCGEREIAEYAQVGTKECGESFGLSRACSSPYMDSDNSRGLSRRYQRASNSVRWVRSSEIRLFAHSEHIINVRSFSF